MQVRPTTMAYALLNAATKVSNETAKMVIRHAITDDPKNPLKTGYNRVMIDGIRVSQHTLSHIYHQGK